MKPTRADRVILILVCVYTVAKMVAFTVAVVGLLVWAALDGNPST